MVEALRERVGGEAGGSVHFGATSQDILDTAMMFIVRDGLTLLASDVERVCAACARLARAHRHSLMAGRTLLQQAVPITFGLKAAGWLTASQAAAAALARVQREGLAVQLVGAAGTLASLGHDGTAVLTLFADETGLAEPLLPWHTDRTRVVAVGTAVSMTCGVMGKIALDIQLLAQTEVAEVSEPAAAGRGRSSAMPQKRNPVGAVAVSAGVRRAQALGSLVLASMVQEHERAAGAWQAEWETISDMLRLSAGAASTTATVLEGLHVDTRRMRSNLDAGGGLIMAEALATGLAPVLGNAEARARVTAICNSAAARKISLGEALAGEADITARFSADELRDMLDPARYLGSTQAFIDRALAAYEGARTGDRTVG